MEGLQRSAVSFRRQGSSGHVWDDKFLGELIQAGNQQKPENQQEQLSQQQQQDISNTGEVKPLKVINTLERNRSNGGGQQRGYRTDKVSPAVEPPSPKISACGFCSAFGKQEKGQQKKAGKVRSR